MLSIIESEVNTPVTGRKMFTKKGLSKNISNNCFFGPIARYLASELSGNELKLFLVINSYSPSYPSYVELFKKSGLAQDTIRICLKKLVEKGFISYKKGNLGKKESNLYEIHNDFIALCTLEFIKSKEKNENIIEKIKKNVRKFLKIINPVSNENNNLENSITPEIGVVTTPEIGVVTTPEIGVQINQYKLTNKTNQQGKLLVGFFKTLEEEEKIKIYGPRQLSKKNMYSESSAYKTLLKQGHTPEDLLLMAIDLGSNGSYTGDKCHNPFSYLLKSDCSYYLNRAKGLLFKYDLIEQWVETGLLFNQLPESEKDLVRKNGGDSFRNYPKELRHKIYKKIKQETLNV